MVKKIQCKNCTKTFNVDFDKAPKDEFVVACPGCQQKYKLKKPEVQTVSKVENIKVEEPKISPVALKQIPCPTCAKVLKIDLNRIAKYPAFIACGACQTKIKLNDPNLKKEIKTGKLEDVKKPNTVKIDKEAINPKNHFTYKLYYHTRKLDYVSKATLFIYLSYLVSSIAKTLSNPTISSIDPQSFLKLRADANALAMQAFSRTVNPILKENGINPRLTSWASGWFVKKLSERIVLTTLENMKVDMNLPYLKKYRQDISSENNKMLQLVTNKYTIFAITFALHTFIMFGLSIGDGLRSADEGFTEILIITGLIAISTWGVYVFKPKGLCKSVLITNVYFIYAYVVVNIFNVSIFDFKFHEKVILVHAIINLLLAASQIYVWVYNKYFNDRVEKIIKKIESIKTLYLASFLTLLLAILSFITHAQNTSSEIFEDTTEIQADIAPQIIENTPTPEQEVIISDEDQLLNYFAENYGSEESNLNFRFDHLSVKNDWACAMVTPLKDGTEYGEPRWNLFNKVNGIWNVVYWSEGVTFENDFELIDLPMQNSRIANLIVEKYPQCPMEIFGVSNNQ